MKKLKSVILFASILIILSSLSIEIRGQGNGNCTIPTDGMNITENTTFCAGTYNLTNGIEIRTDNVVLNCDGSILKGIRWRIYNIGFKLFGNTRYWPKLSKILWG